MSQQREKNLIKLADAVFNLIKNEKDMSRLESYRELVVETMQLLNEFDRSDGTLHPDIGLELYEYYLFKTEGDAKSYKHIPREILKKLKRAYDIK